MKKLTLLLALCVVMTVCAGALADQMVTVTFTGDVTLGGEPYLMKADDSFYAFYEREGAEYFLQNFKPMFEQDDLTVVNLEGVLADNSYGEDKSKQYRFRAPTQYTGILTSSSVELCGLSNNHTLDFGKRGLTSTKKALTEAGLAYTIHGESYVFKKNNVSIGFISMTASNFNNGSGWMKKEVARLKSNGYCSAVVVSIHAGTEYRKQHERTQNRMATIAIEAGADLIIMHHPHVVQGVDRINGRYVFYSLGNFCFGGNRSLYGGMRKESGRECAVVQVDLLFSDEGKYLGQQPRIYPAFISGTHPNSNFQPLLVTGEDAQTVLQRIQVDTAFKLPAFDEAQGCVTLPVMLADGTIQEPVSAE